MAEILAELDEGPQAGRPVSGYQVKVGSERNPFWLHRTGDHYELTNTRPFDPPFVTEGDATLARSWFIDAVPDVPTLCEPVYTPVLLTVRAAA